MPKIGYLICLGTETQMLTTVMSPCPPCYEWKYLHIQAHCCSSLRYLKKDIVVFVCQNCFAFEKADGQITIRSLFAWLCSLRWLVTGLWLRGPRFNPRSAHVVFMVNKVVLGLVFLWTLQFSPISTIPLILHAYSLCVTNDIYHYLTQLYKKAVPVHTMNAYGGAEV